MTLMNAEVIGPFTDTSSRTGVVWRIHRPAAAVSFLTFDGLAVFEGDIILGSAEELERRYRDAADDLDDSDGSITSAEAKAINRDARIALGKIDPRWPNGIVPYAINPSVPAPLRVHDAIRKWEMHTHVRFPRRSDETDYIVFTRALGCASSIGRQGGRQFVYVSDDANDGNVIHEIGHVLGLWHEHSRTNRDEYIQIDFSNIADEYRLNFDQKIADGDDIGDYDFDSIMHYDAYAFAKDPAKPTIRVPSGRSIGQRRHLSAGDITAIRFLYPPVR